MELDRINLPIDLVGVNTTAYLSKNNSTRRLLTD